MAGETPEILVAHGRSLWCAHSWGHGHLKSEARFKSSFVGPLGPHRWQETHQFSCEKWRLWLYFPSHGVEVGVLLRISRHWCLIALSAISRTRVSSFQNSYRTGPVESWGWWNSVYSSHISGDGFPENVRTPLVRWFNHLLVFLWVRNSPILLPGFTGPRSFDVGCPRAWCQLLGTWAWGWGAIFCDIFEEICWISCGESSNCSTSTWGFLGICQFLVKLRKSYDNYWVCCIIQNHAVWYVELEKQTGPRRALTWATAKSA